jgi:hypothetical protein
VLFFFFFQFFLIHEYGILQDRQRYGSLAPLFLRASADWTIQEVVTIDCPDGTLPFDSVYATHISTRQPERNSHQPAEDHLIGKKAFASQRQRSSGTFRP